jgi:hypothetical protein
MYVKINTEVRTCNNFCIGKAISNAYPECIFVAHVNQQAMRIRYIILSSVACPAAPYFFTLSDKQHDYRTKVSEREISVLIFSNTL